MAKCFVKTAEISQLITVNIATTVVCAQNLTQVRNIITCRFT